MLTEVAKVVAIDTDGLWVETHQQSACEQCRAKNGCGQKLLASATSELTLVKALFNPSSPNNLWKVGDEVTIGIEERALINGAFLAYLLPLISMVGFVVLGAWFGLADPLLALSAVSGLGVGGLVVRIHGAQQLKSIQSGGGSCYQAIVLDR